MVKVVNPLFRKVESADSAYMNCACVCYSWKVQADAKSGSWAPFTGGCFARCKPNDDSNDDSNHDLSHSK